MSMNEWTGDGQTIFRKDYQKKWEPPPSLEMAKQLLQKVAKETGSSLIQRGTYSDEIANGKDAMDLLAAKETIQRLGGVVSLPSDWRTYPPDKPGDRIWFMLGYEGFEPELGFVFDDSEPGDNMTIPRVRDCLGNVYETKHIVCWCPALFPQPPEV